MGLDMYLTAEKYISDYNEADKPLQEGVLKAIGGRAPGRVKGVSVEAGYWRKANHIHDWFVKHCQGGVDECQRTWLTRDQLTKLLEDCKAVLADKSRAEELLPRAAGFFFGGQDYDEWYFQDIQQTVDIVQPLLSEEFADWDFFYQSSW